MMDNKIKKQNLSADQLSRDAIVNELDKNFFVEASAGSGKTTSLVYRMVALVEKGAPVAKICTITFTKAAADEFFSRFQKLLSTRSVLLEDKSDDFIGKKSETTIRRCQEALNNIDSCFMGTIDAFCNMIAHEFPFELGIPSDATLISDEDFAKAVKIEFEKILRDDKHKLHRHALQFNDLFYPPYDSFAEGISLVNEKRNNKIIYDESLVNIDLDEYFNEEKPSIIHIADVLSRSDIEFENNETGKKRSEKHKLVKNLLPWLKRSWNEHLKDASEAIKNASGIGNFPLSVEGSLLDNECIVEKGKKSYKFSAEVIEIFEKTQAKIERYKFNLFLYVVIEALDEIASELKKEGLFQFSDFLYYLNEAFKKSASTDRALVNHILERHSYFMLDESQDTNPMQTELFFYLTGTKISSDWTKVEPKEGSLFIVGDPKQSIYGFRSANVEAYKNTEKLFEKKDEVLKLSRNFRSNVSLREWFNASMNDFLNTGDEALEHENIEITEDEKSSKVSGELTSKDELIDGVYKYMTTKESDPDNVAKIIKDLVDNKNKKIISRNKYRNVDYKDFLVVPRGAEVSDIVAAFDKYQIPYYIEANIPFEYAMTLTAIIDLVTLLKKPNDKAVLLKVLFGELYRFSDAAAIELLNNIFSFDISNIDNFTLSNKKIEAAIKELNELYLKTKNMSLSSTMLVIINDSNFKFLNRVNTKYFEYTMFVIELIKSKEEDGSILTINDLVKYVNDVISKNDKQDRVLRFQNELNKVKIANLHKVKGLQAPIVILCKPRVSIKKPTSYLDYSDLANPVFHIKSISGSWGYNINIVKNPDFDPLIEVKMNNADKAERNRLEYVAATRAESVLIVGQEDFEHASFYNPWTELDKRINTKYEIPNIEVPETNVSKEIEYINPNINEECHNQTVIYRSPSKNVNDIKLVSENTNLDEITENYDITLKDKDNSTLIGTMVHKLMQCIIQSRNNIDDVDALINKIASDYDGEDHTKILHNVYRTMVTKGYHQHNSTLPDDILSILLKAKDVRCEVPFSYKNGNEVISGSIDCLYEDESGYHIIDWKTNNFDNVAKLEEEYRGQLDDYIKAMKAFSFDADAHIYHISIK